MATQKYLDQLEVAACRDRIKLAKKVAPFLMFRPREATLEHLARPFGGRAAMIAYARQSKNKQVRLVARVWRSLRKAKQHRTSLAELCWACGIGESEFLGEVITALAERGYDPMPLIRRNLELSGSITDGSVTIPGAKADFQTA
jgi:hypothetical protein